MLFRSVPTSRTELRNADIQEMKTNLAELAHSITALAAVCNKLEAYTTPSTQAAQPLAKRGEKTRCIPTEISGAVPAELAKHSEVVTLKDAASVQNKRWRLRKWLAEVFKTKKTIAMRT